MAVAAPNRSAVPDHLAARCRAANSRADRPHHGPRLRVSRGASRSSPTPPGERRTQPLAGAENDRTQGVNYGGELLIDLRSLLALAAQKDGKLAVHFSVEVVIERRHSLIFR